MSWDAGRGGGGGSGAYDEFNSGGGGGFGGNNEVDGGNNDFGGTGDGGFGGGQGEGRPARLNDGKCYNCGNEGHNKVECPNPAVEREFTGECRLCQQTGHRASNCPEASPMACKNCSEEGHTIAECKNPRKIDRSAIPDVAPEIAWNELQAAVLDRDLDDVKEAVAKYVKAVPDTTFIQLEGAFRSQEMGIFLIGIEKELQPTYTNMDYQGNLDLKFTVTWRWAPTPQRPKEVEIWPASAEENVARLAEGGEPIDRGIMKCNNCERLGHTRKACPEEIQENADRVQVKCYNCEGIGHRVRDCPVPRVDKFACRNCLKSGHGSKDCPEPRKGGSGGCFNCGEDGHSKNDCTNERVMICRNCDERGHSSKECEKPRDYSRIKCSNCEQMGHTKVRCKEPMKGEETQAQEGGYGGGGDDFGAPIGENDAWGAPAAPEPAQSGDW